MLAERRVECEIVESIRTETVRRGLKNSLKPWLKQIGRLPLVQSADFVCTMEMGDVLEAYPRSYAENEALVCLDETSKPQGKETRTPRPTDGYRGHVQLRIRVQRGEQPVSAVCTAMPEHRRRVS